jgi:hypothetical protein
MLHIQKPDESELMELARTALRRRREAIATAPPIETRPDDDYQAYCRARAERRRRSLQSCHRPSLYVQPRHEPPKDSGAFVPATSARIEDDRNLTDGARRCARKLMELTYRADRSGRRLAVTVSFLARALGRCERSVQRYLRMLEREGYIAAQLVAGRRSRMCVGLVITLLSPLLPLHERHKWPQKRSDPGATAVSENHRSLFPAEAMRRAIPVQTWAERCRDGVFRALIRTLPPGSAGILLFR